MASDDPIDTMERIAKGMKIPELRRRDARWILRNAAIQNFDHHDMNKLRRAALAVVRADEPEQAAECGCKRLIGTRYLIACRDMEVLEEAQIQARERTVNGDGDGARYHMVTDMLKGHRLKAEMELGIEITTPLSRFELHPRPQTDE